MPPTLTYEEVVRALEGRQALSAWLELAACLEPRGGWRFRMSADGLTLLWDYPGRRIWVCVERLRRRSPQFIVFRQGRGVIAWWWNCASTRSLEVLLDLMEQGRRPDVAPSGCSHICS